MPRRKPKQPKVDTAAKVADQGDNFGPSPVGWSFYSAFIDCAYKWMLRYIDGLVPLETPEYFTLGSAYHALLEGLTPAQVMALGDDFPKVMGQAVELYEARMAPTAPPLPPAKAIEQTVFAVGGLFSSKPDRLEQESDEYVREFKTSIHFRENDDLYWKVNGQITGEMLATGCKRVIVDVISKDKGHTVRQIEVHFDQNRADAFDSLIREKAQEIRDRVERFEVRDEASVRAFPRQTNACVNGQGQTCPYFDRCWGSPAEKLKYRRKPEERWRKHIL